MNYTQPGGEPKISVGVIAYPTMSNYNDIEPLINDAEITVEFIRADMNLDSFDLILLPGSKRTIEDLRWLKKTGLFARLKQRTKPLYGICGGYQMMFGRIEDPEGIETAQPDGEEGLGFVDDLIVFQREKILRRGEYDLFGMPLKGFEIRHGISRKNLLWFERGNLRGSFVHAVFEDDAFRTRMFRTLDPAYTGYDFGRYKHEVIERFIETCIDCIDCERITRHVL
jgi:adenosylcobyric acid synthase